MGWSSEMPELLDPFNHCFAAYVHLLQGERYSSGPPFVTALATLPASTKQGARCRRYDVNVTPDKRKVFLHHEAEVLQTLQEVMPIQS